MEYNIVDFGAIQGDILQTKAIQSAIDACFLNGGGKVIIPEGIFRTGGLRLRSNVNLHLKSGAFLIGSDNPDDYCDFINDETEPLYFDEQEQEKRGRSAYPLSRWCNAIIRAINAENIAVTGEKYSYIDGVNCYDEVGEEKYRGPHIMSIWDCENIKLEGFTLKDSANWSMAIFNSKNISAKNITVYAGHDGIDLRTCDNVIVEDCRFYTGDDPVAGFDNHDVVVRNCVINTACNGLRFGGNNVLFENIKAFGPANFAFRGSLTDEKKKMGAMTDETCRRNFVNFFTYYCDNRAKIRKTPKNITIKNCDIDNVDNLFKLDFGVLWCTNRSLSEITFKDCKVKNISKNMLIKGDEKEKLSITLENVSISAKEGFEDINFIEAENFEKIILKNVKFENFNKVKIVAKTKGEIIVENSGNVVVEEQY